jgi:hypothetical protein
MRESKRAVKVLPWPECRPRSFRRVAISGQVGVVAEKPVAFLDDLGARYVLLPRVGGKRELQGLGGSALEADLRVISSPRRSLPPQKGAQTQALDDPRLTLRNPSYRHASSVPRTQNSGMKLSAIPFTCSALSA